MSKNAEGWVRHRGGKCPVKVGVKVDYRMRNGRLGINERSELLDWARSDESQKSDIMAYRLHKPAEQVEAVREPVISFEDMNPGMTVRFMRYTGCDHRHWGFVPGKMYSVGGDKYSAGPVSDKGEIPSANWGFEFALVSSASEPAEQPQRSEIVSQLQQECVGLVESANSLNQYGPLQWRDRITEIDATTQALTTERAELVQKLASEGFALIGRINDLLTDAAQKHDDMSDWRNWKEGDLLEMVKASEWEGMTNGRLYKFAAPENRDNFAVVDDCGELRSFHIGSDDFVSGDFKWHSRPSA